MVRPRVSVVTASGAGGEFLFRCLASLRAQATEHGSEVIVVDRVGGATRERLRRDFGWVTLIEAQGSRPSVPELRLAGARRAKSEIVAVLEEHCTAPAGWLAAIREGFQPGDAACGGPILDDDFRRVRDWVVYFSEYHNYLPPWPEGERYLLNGANIAYRREALLKHEAHLGTGYWEVVLHPRLVKDGCFRSLPKMGAHHTGPFDFGYYIEQRYLLSRVWGGTQRAIVSPVKRFVYLVAAPLFPFLLLARIASRVFASGHRVVKFLTALPLLVPVAFAYVWGEWLGYLAGPGDALQRVE
ncbi:MAG: glycosyltransferase [Candidatus Eiseniibacteriota bacterium]